MVQNSQDICENPMVLQQAIELHYNVRPPKKELYKLTAQRLRSLPVLLDRLEDNKQELSELENLGIEALRKHDRSIVRLASPGIRISEEELHATQMAMLRADIAADELEVSQMQRALNFICGDNYYSVIENKYFKDMNDTEISTGLNCDESTVRRHRSRLMSKLTMRLYGAR